MESCLRKE
jgi:hypothetical protein